MVDCCSRTLVQTSKKPLPFKPWCLCCHLGLFLRSWGWESIVVAGLWDAAPHVPCKGTGVWLSSSHDAELDCRTEHPTQTGLKKRTEGLYNLSHPTALINWGLHGHYEEPHKAGGVRAHVDSTSEVFLPKCVQCLVFQNQICISSQVQVL